MTSPPDLVSLSVLAHGLRAATEEMGATLVRSSFSTIIREAQDCSTALLSPDGDVVAQSAMIPMQTRALSRSFAEVRRRFGIDGLREGSAVLLNDPYSGGQHLNDLILFQPVFADGRLAGFAGSTAHHIDIGGADVGVNTGARHLLQEGLVLPPLLFDVERDWRGGLLETIVRANVRLADTVIGDVNAQFAANRIGIQRLAGLALREGLPTLRRAMAALLDRSEALMRERIASIPDGVYEGAATLDGDAAGPVVVRVRARIEGSGVALDFSGTDDQVASMFNCPLASAEAGALSAIRALVGGTDIPSNDGCNRPIETVFRPGSILNPAWPAPVRARAITAYRAFDAVHDALSKAMPGRVPAQGHNTTSAFYLTQEREGRTRVHVDVYGGGLGAGRDYDGASAVDVIMSNCRSTAVEVVEQLNPHLRLRAFEVLPDSGGAGEWRGGLGFRRAVEILEEGCAVSLYSDRFRSAAPGLEGGRDGTSGGLLVHRGGETIRLSPMSSFSLLPGDVVEMRMGGGGGWGDPRRRAGTALDSDLAEGWITPAGARAYAVPGGGPGDETASGRS